MQNKQTTKNLLDKLKVLVWKKKLIKEELTRFDKIKNKHLKDDKKSGN